LSNYFSQRSEVSRWAFLNLALLKKSVLDLTNALLPPGQSRVLPYQLPGLSYPDEDAALTDFSIICLGDFGKICG